MTRRALIVISLGFGWFRDIWCEAFHQRLWQTTNASPFVWCYACRRSVAHLWNPAR